MRSESRMSKWRRKKKKRKGSNCRIKTREIRKRERGGGGGQRSLVSDAEHGSHEQIN